MYLIMEYRDPLFFESLLYDFFFHDRPVNTLVCIFPRFLRLKKHSVIYIYRYISHLLYLFIHWWTLSLFPYLGFCEFLLLWKKVVASLLYTILGYGKLHRSTLLLDSGESLCLMKMYHNLEFLFYFLFFYFFPIYFFISWRLITLQYCSIFVIHWHESAMDLHVFRILIPPPTSLSTRSLWVFPVHQALSHASNLGWWSVSP